MDRDGRFTDFSSKIGQTRSAIQQTKLAHLSPPKSKPKSRFMNLDETLKWARMAFWQLAHFDSESLKEIEPDYLEKKLGWLNDYRKDVEKWSQCQAIVSVSLTFLNEQCVFSGAADMLHARELPEGTMKDETSQRQRPLFYDGPRWKQLDEQRQQQLVGRLSDLCHRIVATLVHSEINQQEHSDDSRKA